MYEVRVCDTCLGRSTLGESFIVLDECEVCDTQFSGYPVYATWVRIQVLRISHAALRCSYLSAKCSGAEVVSDYRWWAGHREECERVCGDLLSG